MEIWGWGGEFRRVSRAQGEWRLSVTIYPTDRSLYTQSWDHNIPNRVVVIYVIKGEGVACPQLEKGAVSDVWIGVTVLDQEGWSMPIYTYERSVKRWRT